MRSSTMSAKVVSSAHSGAKVVSSAHLTLDGVPSSREQCVEDLIFFLSNPTKVVQGEFTMDSSFPPPAPTPQIVYVESRSNNLAVISLIAGIIGTLGALVPILFIVGWGFGVTGIVLGIIALKKSKSLNGLRKTMSKWGIVLS